MLTVNIKGGYTILHLFPVGLDKFNESPFFTEKLSHQEILSYIEIQGRFEVPKGTAGAFGRWTDGRILLDTLTSNNSRSASSLLEEIKQTNLELEKKDGVRRYFRYDWQEIAKYNPDYLAYVEAEKQRLGENHPLFLTQYRLLPIRGGGGFFSAQQKAQLQGIILENTLRPEAKSMWLVSTWRAKPKKLVMRNYGH